MEMLKEYLVKAYEYAKVKVAEKGTWSGATLVAGGLFVLMFPTLVSFAAFGAVGWGIWKIVKKG